MMSIKDFERRLPSGVVVDEFFLENGLVEACIAYSGDVKMLYDRAGRAFKYVGEGSRGLFITDVDGKATCVFGSPVMVTRMSGYDLNVVVYGG